MTCPTTDKLSQYIDDLLTGQENAEVQHHINHCPDCQHIAEAFVQEREYVKETLQSPALPESFTAQVLDELEPYGKQKKRKPKKRLMLAAAGIVLAAGIGAMNPAFAQWIDGLFTSDQVDDGLKIASEAGFGKRINQEVTDQGITLKVEDVVADSSRVALSYQVLNQNGKPQYTYFDMDEKNNQVYAEDQNGNRLESMSWSNADKYGLYEFSLREHKDVTNVVIHFDVTELHGKKGSWKLAVPVDLQDSLKETKTVALNNAVTEQHGVQVTLKEARFAPSSNELFYETTFTPAEQEKQKKEIKRLEDQFGANITNSFTHYGSAIQYHIENEKGEMVSNRNQFADGQGHPSDRAILQGMGQHSEELGHTEWIDSYIPQKETGKLNFRLDGIIKTEPADFSITFKPEDLKKHPVSFEYEGNFLTITEAKKESDYSLRKSLMPIKKETVFTIEIEGGLEAPSSELGAWALVDESGKAYVAMHSGSILDEKDENGRYKTSMTLTSYDFQEVPEELTLHLISVTRFYPMEKEWKVPLHED